MDEYSYKLDNFLFPLIFNISKPNILELGVQTGISTLKFLEICNQNDGKLFSVDIINCSKVSNDHRWKFIKSRDDNFNYVKSEIPKSIDIIYIDSLHEANHVKKIIYGYYDLLSVNGYLFVDDISHLPYLKNKQRNNFYCEINNHETFNKILEIYDSNINSFDLNFSFVASGLTIIKKKTNARLNENQNIRTRKISLKNIARLLWGNLKKD